MDGELMELPADINWPYEIDGELDIAVETGDVGTDDISSINFGELNSSEGVLQIELHDHVIRSANLTRNDLYISKKVKATISGSTNFAVEQGAPPTYMIVKIEL